MDGHKRAVASRIREILRVTAERYNIDPKIIATEKSIQELLSPFRLEKIEFDNDEAKLERWEKWANGLYPQLESGADDLLASIQHWKNKMGGQQCQLIKLELAGSDLHGKGLGAAITEFKKKKNTGIIFKKQTKVEVVIKPEDRNIEKSLLGKDEDSFGNWVNEFAKLDKDSEIKLLEMETHHIHGSIIEFVKGVQAGELNKVYGYDQSREAKQSMIETMTFAFLTGLADLNSQNVIWTTKKHPYLIDADNALNSRQWDNPPPQNGFAIYNSDKAIETTKDLNTNRQSVDSKILKAVDSDPKLFFEKFKEAFNYKKGRVVPVATNNWAKWLNEYAILSDQERIGFFDEKLKDMPTGIGATKGLKGETGENIAGGSFDLAREIKQVKIDFDRGQIPFYVYDYTTGWVTHNGKPVWRGKSIGDAIDELKSKLGIPAH